MFENYFPKYRHVHDITKFKWKKLMDCEMTRDVDEYLISQDFLSAKGDGSWRKYMNLNFENFVDVIKNCGNAPCHFHEVIPENQPMYLVLDFDLNKNERTSFRETIITLKKGVEIIKKAMEDYAGRALEWISLSATDPEEKFSQHVISQSISFKNNNQCAHFIANALIKFIDKYKYTLINSGIALSEDDMLHNKIINLIANGSGFPDLAIYSKNHSLRTCYSSKHGGNLRTLYPIDQSTGVKNTTFYKNVLFKSMTSCFENSNLFDLEHSNDPGKILLKWLIKHKLRRPEKIKVKTKFNNSEVLKTKNFDNRATKLLKSIIPTYCSEWDHVVKWISHSKYFITFNLIGKYCFIKKDTHKNRSGRAMVVTFSQRKVTLSCGFNKKCNKKVELRLSDEDYKKIVEFYEKIIKRHNKKKRKRKEVDSDDEDDDENERVKKIRKLE